jgi:hypothetical protein
MTLTLNYLEATDPPSDKICPTSPPLPIERQRHGTVDTRVHIRKCYATVAKQVRWMQLVQKAYHYWWAIEARPPQDRTPAEEHFVTEFRQMEGRCGWLRGQPPDNYCYAFVNMRMKELVRGVPPPNWLKDKHARAKEVKNHVLAESRRARAQAAAYKPRSPIAKPPTPTVCPPPAPKVVRKLSRYPPRAAGAAERVTDVASAVASAAIVGAAIVGNVR